MAAIVLRTDDFGQRCIVITRDSGEQECFPEGHEQFDTLLSEATVDTPPTPPTWTKYPSEIQQLLTAVEIIAIETSTDAAVILYRATFRAIVSPIPCDNAQFLAGLDVLVAAGILTSQRRTQILAGELPA